MTELEMFNNLVGGVELYYGEMVESIMCSDHSFTCASFIGMDRAGKTTAAEGLRQRIRQDRRLAQWQKKVGKRLSVSSKSYDTYLRAVEEKEGIKWGTVSRGKDLAAASKWMESDVIEIICRTERPHLLILAAPVVTYPKRDLGGVALERIIQGSYSRKNEEHFIYALIATEGVENLGRLIRLVAEQNSVEELNELIKQKGVAFTKQIRDSKALERYHQSQATAEGGGIVREVMDSILCQMSQEGKLYPLPQFDQDELRKNAPLRMLALSLSYSSLCEEVLCKDGGRYKLLFNVTLEEDRSLLNQITKSADGVKKPFLKP